jgi:hypothetical protein
MLYRMRRDIHVQLPPDSFSVSLNILGADPAQPWLDQYRFDIGRGVIAEGLTCTSAEALLAVAAHIANGEDLAAEFARRHPCERMRVTALDALASAKCPTRRRLLEGGGIAEPLCRRHARRGWRREMLRNGDVLIRWWSKCALGWRGGRTRRMRARHTRAASRPRARADWRSGAGRAGGIGR